MKFQRLILAIATLAGVVGCNSDKSGDVEVTTVPAGDSATPVTSPQSTLPPQAQQAIRQSGQGAAPK